MNEATEPLSRQHYLKDIIGLAGPVLITDVAAVGRVFVATVFISKLGAGALALLAVAGSIISTSFAVSLGLLAGTSQLAARHQKRPVEMEKSFYNALCVGASLGVLLAAFFWNFTSLAEALHIPISFSQAASATEGAGHSFTDELDEFFKHYALGMLPFCLSASIRFYLLGAQRPRFISLSNVVGFLICATLTYGLVLGELGMPSLGVVGFAWACTISFWVVFLALALYAFKIRRDIHISKPEFSKLDWKIARELLRLGFPLCVMMSVELGFLTGLVFLMHDYGVDDLAAYQVIMQLVVVASMFSTSIAQAVVVLTSRLWHDPTTNVKALYRRAQTLALVLALCISTLLIVFHHPIFGQFFKSVSTYDAAMLFLPAAVGIIVLESLRSNGFAVLRGLNFTTQPMLVLLACYGGLGVSMLLLIHFAFNLPASSLIWVVVLCNGTAALMYQLLLNRTDNYKAAKAWLEAHRKA